jgi:hypothetical protein
MSDHRLHNRQGLPIGRKLLAICEVHAAPREAGAAPLKVCAVNLHSRRTNLPFRRVHRNRRRANLEVGAANLKVHHTTREGGRGIALNEVVRGRKHRVHPRRDRASARNIGTGAFLKPVRVRKKRFEANKEGRRPSNEGIRRRNAPIRENNGAIGVGNQAIWGSN